MSTLPHRNALTPGVRIEWYEIRKVLGQGGFGITYLALDTHLDKEVAIKEYLPMELAVREGDRSVHAASGAHGEQFEWGRQRFISEARTLAKFKHPNIVRVLSVFEAMNTAYMVMDYEHGQSLHERLSGRRTLEEGELLRLALPLMDGLACVHAAGFIHRDIKPANIFIREDGSPVLLDFGSARQAIGSATRTLTAMVSPGYAPFEQYHSRSDEQGPWTDIYGLAATLYRAAAGVPPPDAIDRSRSLLEDAPDTLVPSARITEGRYSERFQRAIDHGLRFKPQDRPQSIEAWRREFGIDAIVEEVQRLQREPTAAPGLTRVLQPAAVHRPSRARLATAAAIVLLSLAGLGAYRYLEPPTATHPVAIAPVDSAPRPTPERASAAPASPVSSTPGATSPPLATAVSEGALDAETKRLSALLAEAGREREARLAAEQAEREALLVEARRQLAAEQAEREALALAEREVEERRLQAERERQALEAEAQRLKAAEQAERGAMARAEREAEERRLQADRERQALEAEAQRLMAAERAEREAAARADREADERRLQAEREQQSRTVAEAARLAARDAELNACKELRRSAVREPARALAGTWFAAIAVGTGNGWGEAWGYPTRGEAEQVALDACRGNDSGCEVQVWTNDCIAFATDRDGAAGWAWGSTVTEARAKAVGLCEAHSACCTVATSWCADETAR